MASIKGKIITIDRSPKTQQDTLDTDLTSANIDDTKYLETVVIVSDEDKVKVLILYKQ